MSDDRAAVRAPTPGPDAAAVRAARIAVCAIFFLNGAGMANWVVRIPAVRERLHLEEGALGLALLGVAAGSLVAMPLAGRAVARRGSRPVTRLAAVLFALTLAVPALAPNLALLTLALFVLGAANGTLDVAMNAQAATVERMLGRPIMSGIHALWSAGGLVGASIGGSVAARGVPAGTHLAGAALGIAVAMALVAPGMLPADADAEGHASTFVRPSRALLALGVVAFCVLFGEGAMADWSAIYLRDYGGTGQGGAAVGYVAFSLSMAAGRFVGDALTLRLGPARLLRLGGALSVLGLAGAILLPRPWAIIAGFGVVGAGFATVFPTILATAGRSREQSAGTAIAAVSTFGFFGFLVGPPVIGFVAQATSLRTGLALVAVLAAMIVLLAGVVGVTPSAASTTSPASRRAARAPR